MDLFADTPEPPFYAVIFSSMLSRDSDGYAKMAEHMVALARKRPGFLGFESAREDGFGISVSYWPDEASIRQWRDHLDHRMAQKMGREKWYSAYRLRVARVERDNRFEAE
ncbi:antibiotic biosynthesis monooxygenase family protein [Solemya velesiana gill symbiont]|uniref:Antibiotic biosynthesis monooxygenase n=1 Tax=Solemya velesiana gill symbiont TaxID=1918948 RepID=A0A1T2KYM0_9GAMM|nr:antibiotic biosynthesis monooxygenase [Solemya velesiana gill symbiont]OOZ37816.1 antibiotic biosynthesis monooxygenase [Solemya velesiana gill symbiont]